jgi:hypothetical protein
MTKKGFLLTILGNERTKTGLFSPKIGYRHTNLEMKSPQKGF